ncbi:MAG: hypothetical protein EOL87_13770 [Spartobacteria bacterium]|nr:hypothetical protein [Spartobacteria bacterium]
MNDTQELTKQGFRILNTWTNAIADMISIKHRTYSNEFDFAYQDDILEFLVNYSYSWEQLRQDKLIIGELVYEVNVAGFPVLSRMYAVANRIMATFSQNDYRISEYCTHSPDDMDFDSPGLLKRSLSPAQIIAVYQRPLSIITDAIAMAGQADVCAYDITTKLVDLWINLTGGDKLLAVKANRSKHFYIELTTYYQRRIDGIIEVLREAVGFTSDDAKAMLSNVETCHKSLIEAGTTEEEESHIALIAKFKKELNAFRDFIKKSEKSPMVNNQLQCSMQSDCHELNELVKASGIDQEYKADFLSGIRECHVCFANECWIALICLCGRMLELALRIRVMNAGLWDKQYDEYPISGLLKVLSDKKSDADYLPPDLKNIANVIKEYRNSYAHKKGEKPIPSESQAKTVFYAVKNMMERTLETEQVEE